MARKTRRYSLTHSLGIVGYIMQAKPTDAGDDTLLTLILLLTRDNPVPYPPRLCCSEVTRYPMCPVLIGIARLWSRIDGMKVVSEAKWTTDFWSVATHSSLMPRLHEDTCRRETCIPDEQLLSGYIDYMSTDTCRRIGLRVARSWYLLTVSRRHNYYSFMSRSTCIPLYPATYGRQTWDNFVADTITCDGEKWIQVDTTCIRQQVSWCIKRGFTKLEAGHSIECITHAGHYIAFNMFLHFVTLWPWPLTFQPQNHITCIGCPKNIPCTKFEHFGIIRFWVIVWTDRHTDRLNHRRVTLLPRLSSASVIVQNRPARNKELY